MKKSAFTLFVLFLLALKAEAAVPTVTLSASVNQTTRKLTVQFDPSESAANCTYELFASDKKSQLNRSNIVGKRILRATGAAGASTYVASKIQSLRKTGRRDTSATIYLRARTRCTNETEKGLSNIRSLKLKKESRGKFPSITRWYADLSKRFALQLIRLDRAFPALSFSTPIDIQNAGDNSNRLFVAEQSGKIHVFTNDDTVQSSTEFLDISSKIESGGERGLLGLAFHPSFAQNGQFFVHYSAAGTGATVISRFNVQTGNPNAADPASELIIFTTSQPYSNHNGGSIVFGPDGFLYIALGDGGSGGDPQGYGQNRTEFLGKILRIDVNNPSNGRQYGIPSSNPYVGNTQGFKEEIFAYGVRNPWRVSFDSSTHELWAGDVGQSAYEEIDIITAGANLGWNTMEGFHCYNPSTGCDQTGLTLPVFEYSHSDGSSITGGIVYRGTQVPALAGQYVYADFIEGRIWALRKDGSEYRNVELFDTDQLYSAFGLDEGGELYVLSYGDGRIYRFEP